jgi:hypothetical protein
MNWLLLKNSNTVHHPAAAANISHTQQPQNPTEHPHKTHTNLTQFSHSTLARALLTHLTAQIGTIINA